MRVPLMSVRLPVRMPFARHDLECLLRRLALSAGINRIRQELPRSLVTRACHGEGDIRIDAQRQVFCFPLKR